MDGPARAVIPVEFEKKQQRREDTHSSSFMFIGELALETGVDPKTIRFYEREGLLSPPRHGRFRTYMESDVRRLKDVLMMRRLGIGIANIRKMFEANPEITNSQQTINLLHSHLDTLRSRQAEVAKQLEDTSAMLLHYSNQ
ncbi:MAG: MerR family transcriptional regulator [Aestuariivirga sp.]|nr:MerR family transcriptional regulator [Aestuariivirga sp.]